jgi:glucose/arabinose dehydrogenase
VAAGFSRPLDLQHAGDGRLFVVEQEGRILIVSEGQTLDPPFLDIRDRVGATALERGLLGLAFHPRFTENGAFYVNYTDRNGDTVVARFLVSSQPNVADPASEVILLRIDQPFANHNGGVLAFGPDGYLYIGTGDGGSGGDPQGNGQRLDTLLGKILRIDVDGGSTYAIPPDNPFAAGGGLPEIWAYGLRNPWRMAFDTATGDLYIADVGQNQWEEVNFQPAGAPGGVNYGWNLREGRHRFAGDRTEGLIDPVAEYATRLNGCSITGGVVVRDPGLRAWNGIYLYGDWCSGRVWGLLRDASGEWQTQQLFNTSYNISSFGVDHAGEVYLVDHGGAVYRLGPTE